MGRKLKALGADDRNGLERILHHGLRPPFAEGRIEEGPRGEIFYRPREPLPDGRTQLVFGPLDFLRRLANFVPPRGQNLLRYNGILAPNCKHRPALALLAARAVPPDAPSDPREKRESPATRPGGEEGARESASPPAASAPLEIRPRYLDWKILLKRVFELDITVCKHCGGKLEVLAVITDPGVIRKILEHLRLPTSPPPRGTIDDLLLDELP